MKKTIVFLAIILMMRIGSPVAAQEEDAEISRSWRHEVEMNFYFLKNDFILLPMVQTDKDQLHLELRYNYEDLKTLSAWFGYNISGGKNFSYLVTPMTGAVFGNTRGIAVGLELTFDYIGFEFYSEIEYIFDLEARESDFYYSWTDLTYSPMEWFWAGLSAQWTRSYQGELEIERGLLVGGSIKKFDVTSYLYNPGSEDLYVILTFGVSF